MTSRTTIRTLLLIFFCVKYSHAGTLTVTKYGIDENGRSFEYTAPGDSTTSAPGASNRSSRQKTVKRYGIDEHGRSFEYEELPALPPSASVATAPPPVRTAERTAAAVPPAASARRQMSAAAAPRTTTASTVPARETTSPGSRKSTPGLTRTVSVPSSVRPPAIQGTAQSRTANAAPSTIASTPKHQAPARIAPVAQSAPALQQGPAVVTGEFAVKISAGHTPETGTSLQKSLKLLGAPVVRSRVEREGVAVHRLLYARHEERAAAYRDIVTLGSHGQKAYVIREREGYGVYCGSYYNEERARSEQMAIAGKGIRVTIARDAAVKEMRYLMAGGFRTRDAARKLAGTLEQCGINATVIEG